MRQITRIAIIGLLAGFGSHALKADDNAPIALPEPKHAVRLELSVMIPMRDGMGLSTDLYIPEGVDEALGTILIHTPYDKFRYRPEARGDSEFLMVPEMFASQGFIVAVQDKRGKFESEGLYTISGGDEEDFYDSIDWLSKQPWSNGKVATYGCSYLGETQIITASEKHPALSAQVPQAAGGGVGKAGGRHRFFAAWNGGAFELVAAAGWFPRNGNQIFYRAPENIPPEQIQAVRGRMSLQPSVPNIDHRKMWWHLPIIEMMDVAGIPNLTPLWREFTSRDVNAEIFDEIGYLNDGDTISAPALHINSWYDLGARETLFSFNFFSENASNKAAADNQFVIMSPTDHCRSESATGDYKLGELDLGDPRLDYWSIYIKWFDRWLNGNHNGVTDMPKVQYYLMGKNEWRSADAWPVPGTRTQAFYLSGNGRANSRFGDGVLSTDLPGDSPPDHFVYDPASPVPTVGGPVCCTGTPDAPAGAFDQREIEARSDILVYTSEPLENGLEVTGDLTMKLYVSSSAKDTDFTAKLVDVFPDGRALNIQEGILRARYRKGFDRKVWMEPGGVYEINIDMQSTAHFFGPGHRLRVEVSSSNFPRFDRNLNTGGNNYDETEWVVARNQVHHSKEFPSHLLLPVID
jgi:putative CocE/NonD family hydrolase